LAFLSDGGFKILSAAPQGFTANDTEFEASAEFLAMAPKSRMQQWYVADLNGDDRPDLIVIDAANKLRILIADKTHHSILSVYTYRHARDRASCTSDYR
jgi:hypothetical protein